MCRQLVILSVLGLCAYGLGVLAGGQTKAALDRRVAGRHPAHVRSLASPAARHPADSAHDPGGGAAERSAFLASAGATPLEFFKSQVRELDRSGSSDRFSRLVDELGALLLLLSTNDYPKILEGLKDLRSSGAKNSVKAQLLAIWSQKNPRAALAQVLALPEGPERNDLLRNLTANYAAAEPEAALAWVRQLPQGGQRDRLFREVIGGIASRDPAASIKLLDELPQGSLRDNAVERIVDECLEANPAAAGALADKERNVFQHQGLFRYVAAAWAGRDLPQALAWAQGLNRPGDRDGALAGVVQQIAQTKPQEAAQLVMAQPDGNSRNHLVRYLANGWAQDDLPGAANWASRLPEGLRQRAWDGLQEPWLQQDPEGAANFVLHSLPAGQPRNQALQNLARAAGESGWDEPAALQWAGQLPTGTERDAFLAGWCRQSVPGYGPRPEQAARLVAWMSPGETQAAAIEAIAREWLKIDAPAARAWVRQTGLPTERMEKLLNR
jgi:hypothetical protein